MQLLTHVEQTCYFIKNELWQSQTQSLVFNLKESSQLSLEIQHELNSKSLEIIRNQESLEQKQLSQLQMLETGMLSISEWASLQKRVELDVQKVQEGVRQVSMEVNEVINAIGFVHSFLIFDFAMPGYKWIPTIDCLYFYSCLMFLSYIPAGISERFK